MDNWNYVKEKLPEFKTEPTGRTEGTFTNFDSLDDKIDTLSKSFHSHINSNFSQMFSYIKVLDICEENITVSINSKNHGLIEKIIKQTVKKFMDKATIIYKEDNTEDYFIICKKQTCSPKLKNLEEVENYYKNL